MIQNIKVVLTMKWNPAEIADISRTSVTRNIRNGSHSLDASSIRMLGC